MNEFDVVVIGAGQAGLAMGYELQQLGLKFILLDGGKAIGQSWRNRYDSLRLFTPSRYNSLPGLQFPGAAGNFPTKDDVADYLQTYADHFQLPVLLNQQVQRLESLDGLYSITTQHAVYRAKQVVVSTGAFHAPELPAFASYLSSEIQQLHSSTYRNPAQLKPGRVMVVGGGNSGVQLTEELLAAGRKVYFSYRGDLRGVANPRLMLRVLFGLGLVHLSKYSWIGKRMMQQAEPIIGTNVRELLAHPNLIAVGEATSATGGKVACANRDIEDVSSVIWCTGFKADYSWVNLPVFTADGLPLHKRGATAAKGFYFLGLPWLHSRSSGLLGGVSRDAKHLAGHIKNLAAKLQATTVSKRC